MKRLKTFAIYALIIIIFFVFSRIVIFIGLNNTYNNISLKQSIPDGVTISSATATSVNGEVKGHVSEALNSKYIKFNFYSDIDTLMGSYYITPSELENGNFEFYFKLNYINSYSVEITDEPEALHLDCFSVEQFKGYLILSAFVALMFI